MTEELYRLYRDRWKAVEAIEREENRLMTVEQRWKQLNNIRRMDIALQIERHPDDDEQQVYQRWAKLKRMHHPLRKF